MSTTITITIPTCSSTDRAAVDATEEKTPTSLTRDALSVLDGTISSSTVVVVAVVV